MTLQRKRHDRRLRMGSPSMTFVVYSSQSRPVRGRALSA